MPDKIQDLSGYSKEVQEKILEERVRRLEEEENKKNDFRTGRTLLAIGMTSIVLGGPIGIIIGLFLVFYSIRFDSSNIGFGCTAVLLVILMLIGAFFAMLI